MAGPRQAKSDEAGTSVAGASLEGSRILVVEARYYEKLADELLTGATRALDAAGAPATVAALEPAPDAAAVRWALLALPLMRDRFTVADLRFFGGAWDPPAVDRLLEASRILEGAA